MMEVHLPELKNFKSSQIDQTGGVLHREIKKNPYLDEFQSNLKFHKQKKSLKTAREKEKNHLAKEQESDDSRLLTAVLDVVKK